VLEAPGRDELSFTLSPTSRSFLSTKEECERELAIRQRDYPYLEEKHIKYGVPVVGATGLALNWWLWSKAGIRREEVYVDNTLRCLPPKGKKGNYPTGENRKKAEKCCRIWDRLEKFAPDTAVVSMHPAALVREITPLPLCTKDTEKVRDFTTQGRRVMTLLGGKAAHAFLRYAENTTRWRGHYQVLKENFSSTYKVLFDFKEKKKIEKPLELKPDPCKKYKKYKGKNAPRCGCGPCWERYEAKNVQV